MKKHVIASVVVAALIAVALLIFFTLHKKTPPTLDPNTIGRAVKDQAEEMLSGIKNKGEFLYREKSSLAQAAVYEKMLTSFPSSIDTKMKLTDIYYSLANMAYDVGDIDKARDYFGKTIVITPDHSDPKNLHEKLK